MGISTRTGLLLCVLSLLPPGYAAAADVSQPAASLVPWRSDEVAHLWAKAKADYAAKDDDATIADANSYLDLTEPDAQMQALLGKAYFRKQYYSLALEHLRTAVTIAKSHQQPVPARWVDLIRQSGGTVEETAAPASAPAEIAPTRRVASAPRKVASPVAQPSPEQAAAAARAQLIYSITSQQAEAQGEALSQIRAVQTQVGRARAEATPQQQSTQLQEIEQQRQAAQSEARGQWRSAESEAGRARAEAQPSRLNPDLKAIGDAQQQAQQDRLAQIHGVNAEKGFDRVQSDNAR